MRTRLRSALVVCLFLAACGGADETDPDIILPADGGDVGSGGGSASDPDASVVPDDGTPPGGACSSDEECQGGANAACVAQEGFVDGYCIILDCDDDCPSGSVCAEVLASGGRACVGGCGGGCRDGYGCVEDATSRWNDTCFPGCEADASCPSGTGCRLSPDFEVNMCLDISGECSAENPSGSCPVGQVCRDGACEPFECGEGLMEPNDAQDAAQPLPGGDTGGLQICAMDHDWYTFTPGELDTIYVVGVDSNLAAGDLDVDLSDAEENFFVNSYIMPEHYHSEGSVGPTNLELYSVVGANDATPLWLHVYGWMEAVNDYGLVSRPVTWRDGADCEEFFSAAECRAQTSGGGDDPSKLIPFPIGTAFDPYIPDGVFMRNGLAAFGGSPELMSSATQWGRRELLMIVRHAIHSVQEAFPGTAPLGIGDVGMPDGTTPEGHPDGTHYLGANVDLAYYVKPELHGEWGNMVYRQICCDAELDDWGCVDTNTSSDDYGICVAGSENTHVVDLPRTALFIAKLAGSGRLRVVGVEARIQEGLNDTLDQLRDDGIITAAERTAALTHIVTKNDHSSWLWHFNHMHASFCTDDCPAQRVVGPWLDGDVDEQAHRARSYYVERAAKALR